MVHQLWLQPIMATRWYRRHRKTNLPPSRMRLMIRRLKPLPLRPITNRKRKTTKSKTIRLSRKNYRPIKKSRWSQLTGIQTAAKCRWNQSTNVLKTANPRQNRLTSLPLKQTIPPSRHPSGRQPIWTTCSDIKPVTAKGRLKKQSVFRRPLITHLEEYP